MGEGEIDDDRAGVEGKVEAGGSNDVSAGVKSMVRGSDDDGNDNDAKDSERNVGVEGGRGRGSCHGVNVDYCSCTGIEGKVGAGSRNNDCSGVKGKVGAVGIAATAIV